MAAWDSSIRRFSKKCRSMYSTFPLHPLRQQGDLCIARVGMVDLGISDRSAIRSRLTSYPLHWRRHGRCPLIIRTSGTIPLAKVPIYPIVSPAR